MTESYIELRRRNSFGDIINIYFQFLKSQFKTFVNLYLKYNAISMVITLIASYLLVTGFMGMASRDFRFGMGGPINNEVYLYSGAAILILVIMATYFLNFSFASSYLVTYVENNGEVNGGKVWQKIKQNFLSLITFILLGFLMYVGFLIASIIVSLIPFIGVFLQYGLSFTLSAFFGLSFISIFIGNKAVSDAFSEGWNFTFDNFWKVVLFGLIIGILNLMIVTLILSVPGFIISIYIYFSIDSNVEILTSVFANVLFTLGFAIFILAFIFSQALSQLAYGILYYNLFEEKYNIFLREQIEKIGAH